MRPVYSVVAVVLAGLGGCNRPPPTSSSAAAPPAASYKYEVRGAGGAYQRGEAENFTLTAGQNAVSVQGGRLTVNGKAYGRLSDGDSFVVDEGGRVTVNGAPRSPE